jgi:uncharacterized protein (DUF1697 family)
MRYVAFVRGINVGGNRIVKMDRLRGLFEELGLSDVSTFIASGNVLFSSSPADPRALEGRIERRLAQGLGYDVATFVRSAEELAAIAAYDPFTLPARAKATLAIAFLRSAPSESAREQLVRLRTATDDFHVRGRELYWLLASGFSGSTVSDTALGKVIGPSTVRNVTTVRKLAARLGAERKS